MCMASLQCESNHGALFDFFPHLNVGIEGKQLTYQYLPSFEEKQANGAILYLVKTAIDM